MGRMKLNRSSASRCAPGREILAAFDLSSAAAPAGFSAVAVAAPVGASVLDCPSWGNAPYAKEYTPLAIQLDASAYQ